MIAAKNVHYSQLLSPGKIAGLELRNRIVMAAMGSEFANEDGSIGERLIAYYEARAIFFRRLYAGIKTADQPSSRAGL